MRYDRNTNPSADGAGSADDCVEAAGSRLKSMATQSRRHGTHSYEEANTRVVMLSDEAGLVAERYDYSAYGEPRVRGGATTATGGTETGAALRPSAVGNPLQHRGGSAIARRC